MTAIRDNRVTGRRVIVAPGRGARPKPRIAAPSSDDAALHCPFCPGHEEEVPAPLVEHRAKDSKVWRLRVVPNKFPIVTGDDGDHEIIIESPDHRARLATMPRADLSLVVGTWRDRVAAAWDRPGIRSVQLFRNSGNVAGASIAHPHTQLVALTFLPPEEERRAERWLSLAETGGIDPIRADTDRERSGRERIVGDGNGFTTFVPWAAEVPCEQWIVPDDGQTPFEGLSDDAVDTLAGRLSDAARRLDAVLGDVPFNVLLLAPAGDSRAAMPGAWCLRLLPRIAHIAGLELNTGLAVNPSAPEADAAALRDAP